MHILNGVPQVWLCCELHKYSRKHGSCRLLRKYENLLNGQVLQKTGIECLVGWNKAEVHSSVGTGVVCGFKMVESGR